ncbi:hypothetical protein C1646_668689 [Rhizophagus diaphanus]|nr:hypothetical protein C1646_668689 [Rhizophagus diaphanus] [Rhizophagus sp. MUCL 43196]
MDKGSSTACVPTANTIKNDILKIFKNYQTKIQNLLQRYLLDFIYLENSHSSENLANAFLKYFEEKKIFTKTFRITTDNAANNNTFFKEFEKVCIKNHIEFYHKRNHVRYIAHVMNLAIQEILKYIKAEEPQDKDIILDDILNNTNLFTNKIIPKHCERFFCQCNSQNIKELNLILDVKTRWNSMYLMLKHALELQVMLPNICFNQNLLHFQHQFLCIMPY